MEKTDIDVSITDFMFSLGMQYRIYQNDKTSIYAYGALQYNYMDTKIKFSGGQNASFGGSHDWIDPAVGVKIRHQLNERWFCALAAEVGGFGISSDFTWQAMASVGYKINDCWALVASYRHQYVDYTDGGIVYDVNVGGPLIGLIYNF